MAALDSSEVPMPFRYDPKHWRGRAEEMRRLAKDTKNHDVKQMMLRIAAEYEELASQAAKSRSSQQAK